MSLSRFVLPLADVGPGIRTFINAKLFFFETGTSTPKDTFNCPDGTTANSNPVIADKSGIFPDIFMSGSFKVILKDKNDVQIWEADPVFAFINDDSVLQSIDTTQALIASSSKESILETLGFSSIGDGGAAQWQLNGVTGQTVSQSPAQLGDGLLNDASGNQRALVFSYPINVKALGAVVGAVDSLPSFKAALNYAASVPLVGTGAVFAPFGSYILDTDNGSATIAEGVEFFGEGGVQVRRPSVSKQGTVLNIIGVVNSPFIYERGTRVHNLFIDYPNQAEDPVTPVTYPACFAGDPTTKGARSFFSNLIFDRCFDGFTATGGTQWDNVHGLFYRRWIKIETSTAFNHITNCSCSALWHNTTNANTLAYQQDNLVLLEINGGSDGMQIDGFTAFTAKVGISCAGGDQINFFVMGDFLLDGVMDPINIDATTEILSMQFDNGFFRLNNEHGSTFRVSPIVFDGQSSAIYSDQTVTFSNCRFRTSQGGIFRVDSGIDKLILDGCSFFDWNKAQAADSGSRSIIYMNDANANLVINGGAGDNRFQFDAAVETRLITVDAANRVTVNGMDLNKITKLVNVSAGVTLPKFTSIGNTGDNITTPISLGAAAVITSQVVNNNF